MSVVPNSSSATPNSATTNSNTVSEGMLRVILHSGEDLPGAEDLSCYVNVNYFDSSGSTHCTQKGGRNPIFNATFSFQYQKDALVEFEVAYADTRKVFCEAALEIQDITPEKPWCGIVELKPSGRLKVELQFAKALENPPTKATVAIGKGKRFTGSSLNEASVRVILSARMTGQTGVVKLNSSGVFVWNQVFDFEYNNEQQLTVEVLDVMGAVAATSQFDIWTLESKEKKITGDLAVANDMNRVLGKVSIHVVLWDPKDPEPNFNPGASIFPASSEDCMSMSMSMDPILDFSPRSNIAHTPLSCEEHIDPVAEATQYSIRAAEATQHAIKAAEASEIAKEAAEARPTDEPKSLAMEAENAAERAKEAAAELAAHIGVPEAKALEAKRQRYIAEDAAHAALVAAGQALADACERSALRAAAADEIANDIERVCMKPELATERNKVTSACNEIQQLTEKSKAALEELQKEKNLEKARALFALIRDAAETAARIYQVAEEGAKKIAKILRKTRRQQEKTRAKVQKREKELEEENERTKRLAAQKEAARRAQTDIDVHERTILKTAAAPAYHGEIITTKEPSDGLIPLIQDNNIMPAACCYIPNAKIPYRNRAANFPASPDNYIIKSPSRSESDINNSPRQADRYRYDVIAYGIPTPELDILIEGEVKNPMCCMCCGIRWNHCR